MSDTNDKSVEKFKKKLAQCEARLHKAQNPQGAHPLSQSSMEAYSGIALAIVLGVFPMTYWLKGIMFVGLMALCGDFVWRSTAHPWVGYILEACCIDNCGGWNRMGRHMTKLCSLPTCLT